MDDDFDENALFTRPPLNDSKVPGNSPTRAGPTSALSKYFRLPGVNVKLPTNGAYLPKGMIELTQTGEVAVFPMRAADEMLMKSPDALMSGYGLEKLIESCVPAIKTPRLVSTPDIDVLLLAIRAVTYGDKMEVDATCPKCKAVNGYECNLPQMMSNVSEVPSEISLRLTPEIVVYLRPYNLENATTITLTAFEETRKMQNMQPNIDDAKKIRGLNESYFRMTNTNVDVIADCVIKVVVPDAVVTDRTEIREFIANASGKFVTMIEEELKKLNQTGLDKKMQIVCSECKNEWETEVEFDPSTFFVQRS